MSNKDLDQDNASNSGSDCDKTMIEQNSMAALQEEIRKLKISIEILKQNTSTSQPIEVAAAPPTTVLSQLPKEAASQIMYVY